MRYHQTDIYENEVSNLINKLIRFIGRKEIERCLQKYNNSLKSSGPVFRKYFLKRRHPWWTAFIKFFDLEKTSKSIRKNLTGDLMLLAGDAKKISILQKLMPETVRNKFRKDLIDENRAYDYLFEITTVPTLSE